MTRIDDVLEAIRENGRLEGSGRIGTQATATLQAKAGVKGAVQAVVQAVIEDYGQERGWDANYTKLASKELAELVAARL